MVWAKKYSPYDYFAQTIALSETELIKLFRDPTELFTRAVQPVLWLTIFGQVFSRVRAVPTGKVSYLAFMSPGILAQSILFSAIFFGIAIIWEKDLGVVHKLLVTPTARSALVLAKAVSSGFRGLVQSVIIYVVAYLMGVKLNLTPLPLIEVVISVCIGSAIFSTFSLIIACLVKTRERFMGVGQVLTMPLFFASNAIYPIEMMPKWLQTIAQINPMSYLVDSLRALMIAGGESHFGIAHDFEVMVSIFGVMLFIASKLYAGIVY
ncbi:MAG: ABC transporter permease [Bacteriovorax sp.]